MQLKTAKEIIEWAESQKKQMTIFGSLPIQEIYMYAIKAPLREVLRRLLDKPLGIIDAIRILIELNKIKKLILDKLPEPTKETTWHSNSHILDDVFSEFLNNLNLPSREKELEAIAKFARIVYDYDPPYRFLINRLLELWLARSNEWVWHDDNEPARYWKGESHGDKRA